ncbi:MAG: TetR/AcrR family transcriptional regulator [Cyclobacteriaceae bacterium]|nr:TetR/AcrR family transcriptional regulator [Cyclobacteriaceae bacterium]
MEPNSTTENRIKEAARKIFIKKGLAGARMQEIADEAKINKAMLHYYYRNKEQLFKKIFEEVAAEFVPKIFSILGEDRPLEVKVQDFVSHYLDMLTRNPFLPLFVLSELRSQPEFFENAVGIKRSGILEKLAVQLKAEAKAGHIKPISPANFMANLMSLSIFPFLAQPMLQLIFSMNTQEFKNFIEERKQLIPQFIMSSLKT